MSNISKSKDIKGDETTEYAESYNRNIDFEVTEMQNITKLSKASWNNAVVLLKETDTKFLHKHSIGKRF